MGRERRAILTARLCAILAWGTLASAGCGCGGTVSTPPTTTTTLTSSRPTPSVLVATMGPWFEIPPDDNLTQRIRVQVTERNGVPFAAASSVTLKDRVVPLWATNGNRWWVDCSGTFLRPNLLLTAFHCVNGSDRTLRVGSMGENQDSSTDIELGARNRACADRVDCLGTWSAFDPRPDVATVLVQRSLVERVVPLMRFDGTTLPHMVMFGYGLDSSRPKARIVCAARVRDDVGTVDGTNPGQASQPGDSGGPLVAIRRDGTEVILGLVRSGEGYKWYFTPTPTEVPLPASLETDPIRIETSADVGEFALLEECAR